MKRFCVAFISFFENDLQMEVVEAKDAQSACVEFYLGRRAKEGYPIEPEELANYQGANGVKALRSMFNDMDADINAIEI